MDFNKQGLTYILFIIPTIFAVTVIVQGIQKLLKEEKEGKIAIGFGIFFMVMIIATFVMVTQ